LNERNFNAKFWLQQKTANAVRLDVRPPDHFVQKSSTTLDFLSADWKGEDLLSKLGVKFKQFAESLLIDANTQFKAFKQSNRSFKQKVYNEFLSYLNAHSLECQDLFHSNQFWAHLDDENSPYKKTLDAFCKEYCFRSVVVYIFKFRFLMKLLDSLELELEKNYFYSPTSILGKLFQSRSSTELQCHALMQHEYSWYRPNQNLVSAEAEYFHVLNHISVSEIMKACSLLYEEIHHKETRHEFSSSLCHKAFGEILGRLLIEFPKWSRGEKIQFHYDQTVPEQIETLNTKFIGQNLFDISLSHWLSQDKYSKNSWKQIICPEFSGQDYQSGQFLKICHELQFLTFLIEFAGNHQYAPIPFICQMMNQKNQSGLEDAHGQMSIFGSNAIHGSVKYDRVVLNLTNLPKKNPHHSLVTQIYEAGTVLKAESYLFVLTNQNLFVPSQSERVESLLKKLKLKGYFSLESLKGKGDIPSHIYVFSNLPVSELKDNLNQTLGTFSESKEPCHTFKWSGELAQISKLSSFIEEIDFFFTNKSFFGTPLYHKDIDENLHFQFFQDILVDGILVHSTEQSSDRITHPNFFKNLTKTCLPFDTFFQVENLEPPVQGQKMMGFAHQSRGHQSFPLILIVDHSAQDRIQLEIHPSNAYLAKVEKFGTAFFSYYGLIPKISGLSLNGIREFFKSDIGAQVISLSMNGTHTKIKSKIRSILIPSFLGEYKEVPSSLKPIFHLNKLDSNQILALSPQSLSKTIKDFDSSMDLLVEKFPTDLLDQLCLLKDKFERSLVLFQTRLRPGFDNHSCFSNPLFIEKLKTLSPCAIYPKNEDIFCEILVKKREDLTQIIEKFEFVQKNEGCYLSARLNESDDDALRLHSSPQLLNFIYFILKNSKDLNLQTILQGLQVPRLKEFEKIYMEFNELEDSLQKCHNYFSLQISQLFKAQIC
jgi:hypothetical protein